MVVDQVRARRAHISKPLDGWASLSTESGYIIMEAIARPTKYRVRFSGRPMSNPNPTSKTVGGFTPNDFLVGDCGDEVLLFTQSRVGSSQSVLCLQWQLKYLTYIRNNGRSYKDWAVSWPPQ